MSLMVSVVNPRRYNQSYLNCLAVINIFLIGILLLSIRSSEKKGGHEGVPDKINKSNDKLIENPQNLGIPLVPIEEMEVIKWKSPNPDEVQGRIKFLTRKEQKLWGSGGPSSDILLDMGQEDLPVIRWIRRFHLLPPREPVTVANNTKNSTRQYSKNYVYDLFLPIIKKYPRWKGTFVTVGSKDSISLSLEEHGWKGLLVESSPILLRKLKSKHRTAWISDACLSPIKRPKLMNVTSFIQKPGNNSNKLTPEQLKHHGVTCFPLYSVIKAAGFKKVDVLSLAGTSTAVDILKGFPFHQFEIQVLSLDVHRFTEPQRKDLHSFLRKKGYHLFSVNSKGINVYVLKDDP